MAYVVDRRVGLDAQRDNRGVGPRVLEPDAWQPARNGPARQRRYRVPRGSRACAVRAAPSGAGPPFDNGSNTAPSYVTGCAPDGCAGTGVVAGEHVCRMPSSRGSGPGLCVRRRGLETLRTSASSTRWPPALGPIPGVQAASCARPASARGRDCRSQGSQVGCAPVTEARPYDRSCQGPRISSVLYEGDNGYGAIVAEAMSIRSPGGSPSRDACAPLTVVRSPTQTVCGKPRHVQASAARCARKSRGTPSASRLKTGAPTGRGISAIPCLSSSASCSTDPMSRQMALAGRQ